MTRSTVSKLAIRVSRQLLPRTTIQSSLLMRATPAVFANKIQFFSSGHSLRASSLLYRAFSSTRPTLKGLSPEFEEPPSKEPTAETTEYNVGGVPAELSNERYHELADDYLDKLIAKLEQMQEESEAVDCEYSAGVLTLGFPPNGTYVLNKQPPNKQIWLSSPISGPKRFDYVISSEGQDAKEGTGAGDWCISGMVAL